MKDKKETADLIQVEVAYARPDKQKIIGLEVPVGTTALEAVKLSNIVAQFSEIALDTVKLGVFSQALGSKGLAAADAYVLQARDRVEIYRELIADPKEVRKRRAAEAKERRAAAKLS